MNKRVYAGKTNIRRVRKVKRPSVVFPLTLMTCLAAAIIVASIFYLKMHK